MTPDSPRREACPTCEFEWDVVDPEEVSARVNAAIGRLATILSANAESADIRPEPARWSALEYGAHVRDVLLNVRDRLILTAVEDHPSPPPLYREERVALNLYAHESASTIAADLEFAARLFTTTFDILRTEHLERTLVYSRQLGETRTLGWTGAQVLHECEHHLDDVRENFARLRG
jgi:hypothetical protein